MRLKEKIMSESWKHKKLVEIIIKYVENRVGHDCTCFIESDMSDDRPLPAMTNEGFRPDVVYEYGKFMIIGEAKTSNDILKEHSLAQYASYLKKCSLYQGKAMFIMAVPWMEQASANNVLTKIRKDYPGDYEIKILKGIV